MDHDIERITPELALVSAADAERARVLLPDRPWEAFLPPRATPPDDPQDAAPSSAPPSTAALSFALAERAPGETPSSPRLPMAWAPAEAQVEKQAAVLTAHAPGRRAVGYPSAEQRYVRAVVATTLCLIALIWAAGRTPVPGLIDDMDGAFVSPPPAETPQPERTPSRTTRRAGKALARPKQALAVPTAAGYIFSFGVAQISRQRVTVRLAAGCGAGGETPPLSFRGTSFAYRGRLKGAAVSATVNGRIVREDQVSLRIRLRGDDCPPATRTIVARLS